MTESTEHWDLVAACVDAYAVRLTPGQAPPCFDHLLPAEPPAVRSLIIVELAKLEMERLAEIGSEFGAENYLNKYPELRQCTGGVPIDLIIDEVRLRKQHGNCDEAEILSRYPQHREALRRFFAFSDTVVSAPSQGPLKSQNSLRVGDRIEDFELTKLLGAGAFAHVYLAKQATMQRLVALKISSDRGDEPKTLAQLDHPHIVRVYDVRSSRTDRIRILSMQYAPGGTLQQVIGIASELPWQMLSGQTILAAIDKQLLDAGLPPPEESPRRQQFLAADWCQTVCEIGIQLASALEYAHQQRVLHRDVKPANVLLTSEASCKLADFNISFAEDLAGANPSSYFGGSLIYMSPEQLMATQWMEGFSPADLDVRSDLYSLSFVLWELLTLARPWPNDSVRQDWGATIEEILARRKTEAPIVDARVVQTQQVQRLLTVLRHGLAFDREERIATAAELATSLRLCLMPKAWRLLHPESSKWASLACRHPLIASAIAVFLPNGLAGFFNYSYNLAWITDRYPESYYAFLWTSVLINFVSFGIGAILFLWILGPVPRQVSVRWKQRVIAPSPLLERSMVAGNTAALFGVSLWILAGIIFPVLLTLILPNFDVRDAIHFFLSLFICGTVAVAYPFLGVSLIAIECWYGLLAGKALNDPDFSQRAKNLLIGSDRYLLAAVGVPFVGMSLLLAQAAPLRPALLGLVAAGVIGLLIAFRAHHRLRHAVETLEPLLKK